MVVDYAEFPTSKELWDNLQITYGQRTEGVQIFDLTVKANSLKRGNDIVEQFFSNLRRLWREIETRQANPMTCAADIATFNRLRSE